MYCRLVGVVEAGGDNGRRLITGALAYRESPKIGYIHTVHHI
jgi:hypothetical protein